MRRNGWKHLLMESWAFIAVAVIAFVAGWLIGDLGSSTKTETVHIAASASEGEEAGAEETETTEAAGGTEGGETESQGASSAGAQVFTSADCGSCHTLAAAGSTGEVGPNLNEFLAPDDDTQGVEVMIVEPNSELAEGYPANVMPQNYGQQLSGAEVHQLAEFLVESTPAKP